MYGNGMSMDSIVTMWCKLGEYAMKNSLNKTNEFREIHSEYATWYGSYEQDGTKTPKEGLSKWSTGISLLEKMNKQLKSWESSNQLKVKDNMYVQCAWCKKFQLQDGTYAEVDGVDSNIKITHTICPDCMSGIMAEIK